MSLIAEIRSLPVEEGLELALSALTTITASDEVYLADVAQAFGLAKLEARLLIHLAVVHPRISPMGSIATALWGYGEVGCDASIRHSVKRLRQALGRDVIAVNYGVGYRLSDEMAARMPERCEIEIPLPPRLPKGKWRGYEPWTPLEDAVLDELLARRVSHRALAELFGRSKNAIDHRAKKERGQWSSK